jgi:hypothetical protein
MNRFVLTALLILGAAACAEDSGGTIDESNPQSEDETNVGRLSLSLTGVDSQGRQYRLRNAQFYISNNSGYYPYDPYSPGAPYPYRYDGGAPSVTVVSTESDPDADFISVRLVPGGYYVGLEGDWYIERVTTAGPERIERAVLLNGAYQYAYVYQNGAYNVVFRFGVDGDLIDFRHGDLIIDTEFELPGDSDYDAGPYPYPRDGGWSSPDAGAALPSSSP